MTETDHTAPAASAPAGGEPPFVTQPEGMTEPSVGVPSGTADESRQLDDEPGDEGRGDHQDEEHGVKRPSRSQRLQRKVQLLTAELDELRRARVVRPHLDAAFDHADRPPHESDFNGDYLAYERALNAYTVRHAAREAVRQEANRDRIERVAAREVEHHRDRVIAHVERVEELREQVADYGAAMKVAATIPLRDEVAREILGSEKSALIQYHLAKNPSKAREINGLSGRELARAIGRLEGAVRLPAARRATGAAPPFHPLTGATGPAFDPFKAEMADYAANWKRRQAARHRP
jgi:hypothetical protein